MPKQTFYNLPSEKKNRLLSAAYEEFSKSPLEEASINAIVQQADISRGSFYQYFEDKEDLYFYCLELLKRDSAAEMLNCFRKAEGELFSGLMNTFEYLMHHFLIGEHKDFYRQFFIHLNYQKSKNLYRSSKPKEEPALFFEKLASEINLSPLKVENKEELQELLQFLFQLMHGTISQMFTQGLSEEEAHLLMEKRLKWIAEGILKEK